MKEETLCLHYKTYDYDELPALDRQLIDSAKAVCASAYAPYSKFQVGAAAWLDNGEIVCGSNQENAAYPSGICAERTALFYAGASRPDKAVLKIAIAAGQNGVLCSSPVTPCGACRQVMAQYQLKGGHPIEILLIGTERIWKFAKVEDLLPFTFDSI
jgi:cytidine deaminase